MKVLLSILFILTGIYSCFFIEAEQIPFYKNYFQSWVLTLLISHLIPSFYLIIGFLLFFTRLNKVLLYISSLSIFFFLIEIFLHNFFGYDINIICLLVTLLFVIIFTSEICCQNTSAIHSFLKYFHLKYVVKKIS